MPTPRPGESWFALLAPLPEGAVPERRPVAPPEMIASGAADAIAGWESLSLHISAGDAGLRHVLVTIDASGSILSGGDTVLFQHQERRGETVVTVYDQENIGGRYWPDGSFKGTRWKTRTEQIGDADDDGTTTSTPSQPSADDVAALRRIVDEMVKRA